MRFVDCHCHIEDPKFSSDRDKLILKWGGGLSPNGDCPQCGLEFIVTSIVEPKDYGLGFELAEKYGDFVKLSMAVHPSLAAELTDREVDAALAIIRKYYHATVRGSKCCKQLLAIGETGLDYYWIKDASGRGRQAEVFVKFIKLAQELDLPVVVHIRSGEDKNEHDPYSEAIEILEKEDAKRVLLHMFGAKRFLQRILDNGWYVSTNAICQTSKEHTRIVRVIPLDRLLLETDSPYLVPEPEKSEGIKRNEPMFVRRIAERVAQIRDIGLDEVVSQTTTNARRFFGV